MQQSFGLDFSEALHQNRWFHIHLLWWISFQYFVKMILKTQKLFILYDLLYRNINIIIHRVSPLPGHHMPQAVSPCVKEQSFLY